MGVKQEVFATPRDLEEGGRAREALQQIGIAERRRALKRASGFLAPYIRKRNALPLTVELDADDWDTTGMTGGAVPTITLAKPTLVQDVRAVFTAGTVGQPGITYAIDVNAGAYGSAVGASIALPLSGVITIDGCVFVLPAGGTTVNGDSFTFSTRVDAGVARATVMVAAWDLLGHGGSAIDSDLRRELQDAHDVAVRWARDLGKGDGDLEPRGDATPDRREGGFRFFGQRDAYEWVRGPRRSG